MDDIRAIEDKTKAELDEVNNHSMFVCRFLLSVVHPGCFLLSRFEFENRFEEL